MGLVPPEPGFLEGLRDACTKAGALLIFDEVITGFRWSPGGVQALSGVTPDLSTQAKVLAGGFPGGAVVGRADVLNLFNFPADPEARRFKRIAHPGTFNANPVSAAAGVATLHLVKSGEPTRRANEMATLLRAGLADVFRRLGVPGLVYGDASVFWLLFGPALPANVQDTSVLWQLGSATLQRGLGDLGGAFRRAMLLEGVDLMGATGMLSAAHDTCDVERTIDGFERALIRLRDDGALAS
jgi:glutamate-1-semialdehyde 2,1-aminomutase